MIDPRLQAAVDAAMHPDPAPDGGPGLSTEDIVGLFTNPPRIGPDGTLTVTPALRQMMDRAPGGAVPEIPGAEAAPAGPHRDVGGGISAANDTPPVTGTSAWFTAAHWHWLAAKDMTRPVPLELGPTAPFLFISEAQIIRDLREWSVLDARGHITAEAAAMFEVVSGTAELTLYGTVLLYAHRRREPVEIPAVLEEYGVGAGVRDIPRISFAIGLTSAEIVTTVVNNGSVVFTRRWRRGGIDADAAVALRTLLDPQDVWPPYPLPHPVVIPHGAVEQLARSEETAGVIDTEPGEEATAAERATDAALRARVGGGVRSVLREARIPSDAAESMADIAAATTDALAQVVVRTSTVDVSRGEPSALALAFLRGKGVVASYPGGSGQFRRVSYVPGTASCIETGIASLRRVVSGG